MKSIAETREAVEGSLRGYGNAGLEVAEVIEFHGYYTLHTEKDGEITGMLNVNGYSGEVLYHSWHGPFVAMEEARG